jgi:hypothetical protein
MLDEHKEDYDDLFVITDNRDYEKASMAFQELINMGSCLRDKSDEPSAVRRRSLYRVARVLLGKDCSCYEIELTQ